MLRPKRNRNEPLRLHLNMTFFEFFCKVCKGSLLSRSLRELLSSWVVKAVHVSFLLMTGTDWKCVQCTEASSVYKQDVLHREPVLNISLWRYSMMYALMQNKERWYLLNKRTTITVPVLSNGHLLVKLANNLTCQDVYPALP